MAKTIGFSIYDTKAEAFMPPWFQPTVGLGIRMFSDLCRDANSTVSKHLDDYRLYKIGEFDDSTGDIGNPNTAPVMLVTARDAESVG